MAVHFAVGDRVGEGADLVHLEDEVSADDNPAERTK
jgi:hypothetical protein